MKALSYALSGVKALSYALSGVKALSYARQFGNVISVKLHSWDFSKVQQELCIVCPVKRPKAAKI